MALTRKASSVAKRPTKSSLQDPSAALAELAEARCQQAAVSEVLQIVSDSPGDLAAVSDAIVDRAKRLCGADGGGLWIVDGAVIRVASTRDVPEAYSEYLPRERGFPLAELFGQAACDGPFLQIEDLSSTQAYRDRFPLTVATVEAGFRTSLGVPLHEGNAVVGIINLIRREARPFSENQIALVQAFAAQAQIAVKNARLFNETKEALERQTATAEILRVISQALTDPQPVFERIVATAALVLRCDMAIVLVREGDIYVHTAAATPEGSITDFAPERFPIDASANFPSRAFLAKTMLHLPDWSQIDLPKHERYIHETFGLNSALYLPLLRGDECIALLVFAGRRANIFGPSEIAHAESFRDQALIAIENARLFNETQEALRQQTATSDILRVIASSPNDLQPVLDKIVETACRLCKAYDAVALLREGDQLRVAAHCGPIPITFRTQQINRGWAAGRAVIERRAIHIDDFAKQAHEYPVSAALASRGVAAGSGNMLWRANVVMPLMREGEAVGVIGLRRAEPVPFSEGQIELLKTFSDQAVIAIENVRLFEEVQSRTRDLTVALEQQTASAEILQVISSSPTDVQPVFDAIARSAAVLCEATNGTVFRLRDGHLHLVGHYSLSQKQLASLQQSFPVPLDRETASGRAILDRAVVHIHDIAADPGYSPALVKTGLRSVLSVPMLRSDETIGSINVSRGESRPFSDRQIELLKTFADQAVIAINNVGLFNETQEALEQQKATADVLKVISRSAFDLDAVFDALLASAVSLVGGRGGTICVRDGDVFRYRAVAEGRDSAMWQYISEHPATPGPASVAGRVLLSGKPETIRDTLLDSDLKVPVHALAGLRSIVGVPLLRDGRVDGALMVGRAEAGPFDSRQIDLLQTFADQAVIAIENLRLFDEVQERTKDLQEALQQQTATADVLKIISRSAFDLDAVLKTLTDSARSLSGAATANVMMREGDALSLRAESGCHPDFIKYLDSHPSRPGRDTLSGRVMMAGEAVHIPDVLADPEYDYGAGPQVGNYRAMFGVPLILNGKVDGVFVLMGPEPGAFTPRQMEVVRTFADQAVIAIENVRLFDEVRARTRDLQESLEQQTASAEILRVISSSPTDVQPVFDAIAHSAAVLCEATNGTVFRLRDGLIHLVGYYSLSQAQLASVQHSFPAPLDRGTASGRAILECGVVHIRDIAADPEYSAHSLVKTGLRSVLSVPMLRNGEPIGSINVSRDAVRPFSERQIELLKTFADQAVIAINNVGLFNETREALEQQKATADVLKVISRSAFDLDAVLQTLTDSARSLSGAASADVEMFDGNFMRFRAQSGCDPELVKYTEEHPLKPGKETVSGRVMMTGEAVHIPDVLADPDYDFGEGPRIGNYRAVLGAPLIRDGKVDGVFTLMRPEPGAFTPRQIELVQTFADQAVIAIENVRLFDEVQARTKDLQEALQQQTATADVLKVISRSAFDLQTVLDTLVRSAGELCEAVTGAVYLQEGQAFHLKAHTGLTEDLVHYLKQNPQKPGRGSGGARVLLTGQIQNIPDVQTDEEFSLDLKAASGRTRALLGVPLLRDQGIVGAIVLTRPQPGEFTARQIEIVQTFADQAVIAIENSRLFEEVQARTRELSASLHDLRKAQDRLIQSEKLASLGQLTAGIAHEIKNPLNFVNNFSALSRELIEELAGVIKAAPLDAATRDEAGGLIGTIGGNLDRVVQHGKRADSIVKNMLLHSRQGSGERSTMNINAMVEESLNLAYHGARAEKPGFNVTIAKSLDPSAGAAEVYAQEMTRVLLNLISNGFYATTRRKQAAADGAYEPTLTASTRDLGSSVEIAIRDNGTGVSDEVKAKMFNPFFTTKPAGEGTGLGLSLSHDIVVKQHGGTLEVSTEQGSYTQFTIVLPRAEGGV